MGLVGFTFLLLVVIITLGSAQPITNPVKQPVLPGRLTIQTRFFAQIPNYRGAASKIVAIVPQGSSLYVSTSSSGGLIYRVNRNGKVFKWFDVAAAIFRNTGRRLNVVNSQHGGIRGIAFHPSFNANGLFYVSAMEDRPRNPNNFRYFSRVSNPIPADSVVLEFRYSHAQKQVLPNSYRQVLRIEMPVYDHPVKQMAFDGPNLLITHGDGSVQSAITGGGQNNDALGKVLRINPLRNGNAPYTVPRNNPYIGNKNYADEIFAIGFRNPHNICVSKNHGIFITDAGRDNVEEVNIIKGGQNYGWSKREGTFVHLERGGTGLGVGVRQLAAGDETFGFTYPNVQVGHSARRGDRFVGIALAGSCPIENGSPLRGIFIYANFPTTGEVYYSRVNAMKKAVVRGPPSKLTQAQTYQAKVLFDHDRNPKTPPLKLNNLRDVIRREGLSKANRADIRFGRGPRGELYWSSKQNGRIYLITNSVP